MLKATKLIMKKICDLHLHSKYSGGASRRINIYTLANNSKKKGVELLGTISFS